MRDRRYEQGGVVSFVIVAVVLAALLGAGIWWAKRMQTTAITPVAAPTASTDGSTNQQGAPQTGQNDKSGTAGTTNGQPSGATGSQESSTGAQTPTSNSGSTGSVAATGPSVSQVPSAGPSEVLATGVFLSAGSALAYYLVQSRRRIRASALK